MRNKIFISLIIIVLILVSGYISDQATKIKSGEIKTEEESTSTTQPEANIKTTAESGLTNPRQVTLQIEGMIGTCCEYNIKNSLKYIDGVMQADISFSEGGGKVIYDPSKITKEEIVNAIPESFTITIIEDKEVK